VDLLTQVEARVIGSLMEKQMTTPEYYPISLNALTNACNQLSNRDPVVSYEETVVSRALENLREKKLVWMVTSAGARVPKYEHRLTERFSFDQNEAAIVCVLLLRGPQTPGEIRSRTGRMCEFRAIDQVEATLQKLIEREPPLVTRLERRPGTKESRYAHLLSGEVDVSQVDAGSRVAAAGSGAHDTERLARLEQEVESLERELAAFREEFLSFKSLLE
jgi:uncharacterized protein YceH (UPF0502 family)